MNDIIVAISTALGKGAISIVRLSGKGSIELVSKCFKGKDLTKADSHTINYGYIVNNDAVIDQVLVSIMRAPKTYTREDIVEINCHGGIAATNKILEVMILNGARLAEPGEFTKRAFLNGRIDLVEAAAVMDLVNSKTEKARIQAVNQLEPGHPEHQFYQAQIYTLLYIQNKSKANKSEAQKLLEILTQGPQPFPHSQRLKKYVSSLK